MFKLLIISTTLLLSVSVHSEPTVIRITNGEWEPYLSEYSYEYGLASHLVKEAFKEEGIKVKWGFMPWKRSYEYARIGQHWDASAVWWPSKSAKKDFLISLPVVKTSMAYFHLKTFDFKWKNMMDLQGLTVGITRGYEYGKSFDIARKEGVFDVSEVATDEQNFRMLLHGRIDVFPNDPLVGNAQLRGLLSKKDAGKIISHPLEFEHSTLHLLVSKKSSNADFFVRKFNSGLTKLKDSGKVQQLFTEMNSGTYDKQKNKWQHSSFLQKH